MKQRWVIPILILIMSLTLLVAQRTDADLSDEERANDNQFTAGHLDISGADSATMQEKHSIFQVPGLVAGGFQVEAIHVRNLSDNTVPVQITIINSSGSSLCEALQIRVLNKWSSEYLGTINEVLITSSLEARQSESFVFSIELNNNSSNLKQQSCNFDIKVASAFTVEESPFYDEEIFQNQISTGVW